MGSTVDGTSYSAIAYAEEAAYWATQAAGSSGVPHVIGHAGKFLTTNGFITSWGTLAISDVADLADELADKIGSVAAAAALDTKLDKSGGELSGGVGFGSVVASAVSDFSKHISLYGATYGFSITGSRLNYVADAAASHRFLLGATEYLSVTTAGIAVKGKINNSPAHREAATNLTGTTLDLAAGTDFYKSISSNTTITLSNVSAAAGLAQASSLIVNHTGGTISFAGATFKWAGGAAPSLSTGRVHQFFFWPDPIASQVLISVVSYY